MIKKREMPAQGPPSHRFPNPLGICAAPLDLRKGFKEESKYNRKITADGISDAGKTNSKAKAEKRRMLTLMYAHKDGTAAHHLPSAISNPFRRAQRHPKRCSRNFKGKAQPGNDGPWRQIAMARPKIEYFRTRIDHGLGKILVLREL